jgi:hypothetical protein
VILFILIAAIVVLFLFTGSTKVEEKTVLGAVSPAAPVSTYITDGGNSLIAKSAKSTFLAARETDIPLSEGSILAAETPIINSVPATPVEKEPEVVIPVVTRPESVKTVFRPLSDYSKSDLYLKDRSKYL